MRTNLIFISRIRKNIANFKLIQINAICKLGKKSDNQMINCMTCCKMKMMKRYFSLLLFSILLQFSYSQDANLIIDVLGINEVKGIIQVGIYNNSDSFPKIGGEYRVAYFTVSSKNVTATIENLPQGEYAAALYHDLNSDGECNLNFLGIPKEPYGFSNNIKPFFRAPSYELTKITLKGHKTIQIKLID